jgi:hypothetical protein
MKKIGKYTPAFGDFFVIDERFICCFKELKGMYFKFGEKYIEEIDGYGYDLETKLPYRFGVVENKGKMRPATEDERQLLIEAVCQSYEKNLMNDVF